MTLGSLGAVLGGAAGHDSCCCSGVSETLLKAHVCDGLAGVAKSLFFLRASVGDVRHFGRCAWRCCWARFLLLFGCFGTAPQSSCSAMGWLAWQNLCFLRASVGGVRHFGRCAWRCCWARFLLLFGCFGTAPQSSCSAMGWLAWQNLCFLRASVGDVRHFGRCAWRCCWARFLLLFSVSEPLLKAHVLRGVGGMGGSP